jgi:hypothetical protein
MYRRLACFGSMAVGHAALLLCLLTFGQREKAFAQMPDAVKAAPERPAIKVLPEIVDHGKVRLHRTVSKGFMVGDTGDATLNITDTLTTPPIGTTDFKVGSFPSSIPPNVFDSIPTTFTPQVEGLQRVTIEIKNDDPNARTKSVQLLGTGIYPRVWSTNVDFGKVRVGRTSRLDSFVVQSTGSDTTSVETISIVAGDKSDFDILTARPSASSPLKLEAANVPGGTKAYYFTAVFHPTSLGPRKLIIRIHSPDTAVPDILDTLFGVGVEPYIEAEPTSIVFPTIFAPRLPATVSGLDARFVLHNRLGSMRGVIDSLVSRDPKHFSYTFGRTSDIRGEILPESDSEEVFVHFKATEAGDFFDTVSIFNDSRNTPRIAIRASVRSDTVEYSTLDFKQVVDCEPRDGTIEIYNPNSVSVSIDTISFAGDTAGFSYSQQFLFPINIASGQKYSLGIRYRFPPDSLNGTQTLRLLLKQRAGNTAILQPVILETTVSVERDIRLIQLSTEPPSYTPSAGDALPFRLPITVVGDRSLNTELNDFEMRVKFNNDVFQVVGMDRTGSLTEKTSASDPADVTGFWDEATSTYIIRASNVHVADPNFASNNLLVTLLVVSFVTPDTTSVVVPEFVFQRRPCAYALEKRGITLPYANDCGDPALRRFYGKTNLDLLTSLVQPVTNGELILDLKAKRNLMLSWQVTGVSGEVLAESEAEPIASGNSRLTLSLPSSIASGVHFLSLRAVEPLSGNTSLNTLKFSIIK